MSSTVLAIIPARGGSKGIPFKNIKEMGGFPLISYSIASALACSKIDRCIVSTDDMEIAQISQDYGAEIPFMRPTCLAEDDTPDFPVFEHAVKYLAEKEDYHPDIIVQLRPTSPLRSSHMIEESIHLIENDTNADCVRSIMPSIETPFKMWTLNDNKTISPLIKTDLRESYNMPRQKLPMTYSHTGHIDVIRTSTIINKKSLTGDVIIPYFIDPMYNSDIDTLNEWQLTEALIQSERLEICKPKRGYE